MKRIFVDLERCMGCKTCELICAIKHSNSKDLFTAINERPKPISRVKVIEFKNSALPLQCRQCPEPYCYFACIAGGIRMENGNIIFDNDKCIHCYSCVMACPYGVIKIGEENVLHAVKCDLCPDEEIPPCVVSCPTKALFYGEIEDFKKLIEKRKEKCTT